MLTVAISGVLGLKILLCMCFSIFSNIVLLYNHFAIRKKYYFYRQTNKLSKLLLSFSRLPTASILAVTQTVGII